MPKISVIVPIYNVEQYFVRCVDSILNQTFSDFELILVDDASPDRCPILCDEYAKKDSRVRVIHKENGGVCRARNSGLDIATGEYIVFCDGDDYWKQDLLEKAVDAADKYDADQVYYRCIALGDDSPQTIKPTPSGYVPFATRSDAIQFVIDDVLRGVHEWAVWSRLYRASIIKEHHIRFCETCNNFAEDMGFTLLHTVFCQSVCFMEDALYYYWQREGSMMNRSKEQIRLNDVNEVSKHVWSFLKKVPCVEKQVKNFFGVIHYLIMWNQYGLLVYGSKLQQLPCYTKEIKDKKWFHRANRMTLRSYGKLAKLYGKHNARRIQLFTRYANHEKWKLYYYPRAIYYKLFLKKEKLCQKYLLLYPCTKWNCIFPVALTRFLRRHLQISN